MEDVDKEIIDLTKADEPEVIVLDSDVPSSSPSRVLNGKRKSTREEDTEVIAVEDDDVEQQVSKSSKKSKRTRKKRKRALVGAEDGEIVEDGTANTSVQVSGEGSSDKSETEEQQALGVALAMKKKKGNGEERISLLARLSTMPVAESQDVVDEPVRSPGRAKSASKAEKKRKKREQQRESKISDKKDPAPSHPDDPPPYFIDDRPSDASTFAIGLPPPLLLASSATVKADGPTTNQETAVLLLPPHVSVIELNDDTPIVEIKAPVPDDSEDEDYIDYVQYDDDQVVSIIANVTCVVHFICIS